MRAQARVPCHGSVAHLLLRLDTERGVRDKTQAFLSEKTVNLPSNKNSLSQVMPVLAQFADDMDNSTHPNVYPVHEKPAVTEAFDKGIQSILIGEMTPEAVSALKFRNLLSVALMKNCELAECGAEVRAIASV